MYVDHTIASTSSGTITRLTAAAAPWQCRCGAGWCRSSGIGPCWTGRACSPPGWWATDLGWHASQRTTSRRQALGRSSSRSRRRMIRRPAHRRPNLSRAKRTPSSASSLIGTHSTTRNRRSFRQGGLVMWSTKTTVSSLRKARSFPVLLKQSGGGGVDQVGSMSGSRRMKPCGLGTDLHRKLMASRWGSTRSEMAGLIPRALVIQREPEVPVVAQTQRPQSADS